MCVWWGGGTGHGHWVEVAGSFSEKERRSSSAARLGSAVSTLPGARMSMRPAACSCVSTPALGTCCTAHACACGCRGCLGTAALA
eukprot:354321-Chlamydomonas_euryale.AAC.2